MTNTDKVYRSLNLSMREWTTDIFHGMSQYDEHTDLSRSQWSEAIQSNIRNGDIAGYDLGQKIGRALKLDKGMYFLIRKERYVDIKEEDLSNVDENDSIICISPESPVFLKIIGFPEYGFESFKEIKIFLKIIPESEYQNQIAAKKLNEEFPPEKPKIIYDRNKHNTDDFPETDCELIFPFKPTKGFTAKIKVSDVKETTELKAGDYVRLKDDLKGILKSLGVRYDNCIFLMEIKDSGISKVLEINSPDYSNHTYFNIPIACIKKIITLPTKFKIDCGDKTKEVLSILNELGFFLARKTVKTTLKYIYNKEDAELGWGSVEHGDEYFLKCEYPELTLSQFYAEVGLEMPAITKDGKLAGEPKYTDEEREEMEMLYCESKKMKLNISDAKELLNKYHNFKTYIHGVEDIYPLDDELTDDDMQERIYGKSKEKPAETIIQEMLDKKAIDADISIQKSTLGINARVFWLEERLDDLDKVIFGKMEQVEVIKVIWIEERNLIVKELNKIIGEK